MNSHMHVPLVGLSSDAYAQLFGENAPQDTFQAQQAVDALLADFGSGSSPLVFDYQAEDLLLDNAPGLPPTQQQQQQQQQLQQQQSMDLDSFAVLSNIAAHGAAVRPLITSGGGYGGIPAPAWRAWGPQDEATGGLGPLDVPLDVEQTSSDLDRHSGASQPQQPQQPQQQPSSLAQPAWQAPPLDLQSEAPSAAPTEGGRQTRRGAGKAAEERAAAAAARERERAEKLKEKNKRAQRKFRQRQKDRRESAERTAAELAEQLQRAQAERDSLAARVRQLEERLAAAGSAVSPQPPPDEAEPTFCPAKGWSVFNPFQGMILTAICNPPQAFSHRQMLTLSLRDLTKLMAQLMRRLKECLDAIKQQAPNPTAEARIKALLAERHALMAYTAINRPRMMYQILTTKMTDPPEPSAGRVPREHWIHVLDELELSEEQLEFLIETRRLYIARVRGLVLQRQALGRQMQELEGILTDPDFSVNHYTLTWSGVVQQLQANLVDLHKCHTCLMVRCWFGGCLTPVQVAKLYTAFAPYPLDIYDVLRELIVRRAGEPPFAEYLAKGLGSLRLEQEASAQCHWPRAFLTPEAQAQLEAQRQQEPDGSITV